jgi:hypothetical protein
MIPQMSVFPDPLPRRARLADAEQVATPRRDTNLAVLSQTCNGCILFRSARLRMMHDMKVARSMRGARRPGDTPNWAPLEDLLGDEFCTQFMWMGSIELEDGTRLDAYKHTWTRCYLHLSGDGRAFYYIWRNGNMNDDARYRECEPCVAIEAVFQDWECCTPTDSDRAALRAALRKARGKSG